MTEHIPTDQSVTKHDEKETKDEQLKILKSYMYLLFISIYKQLSNFPNEFPDVFHLDGEIFCLFLAVVTPCLSVTL